MDEWAECLGGGRFVHLLVFGTPGLENAGRLPRSAVLPGDRYMYMLCRGYITYLLAVVVKVPLLGVRIPPCAALCRTPFPRSTLLAGTAYSPVTDQA